MAFKEDLIEKISMPASGIADPIFELEDTRTGKVTGFIISKSFEGLTQIERQNQLWKYLDTVFEKPIRQNIVTLVTMTPEEVKDD